MALSTKTVVLVHKISIVLMLPINLANTEKAKKSTYILISSLFLSLY